MLAIWGLVVAVVALVAGVVVPVVLYLRQNGADIKVTSEFDKTGFVEVVIAKSGRGPAHIDSVELMQADTSTRLPLIARSQIGAGPIDFDGGKATKRAYYKLVDPASNSDAIEVNVGYDGESSRVKSTWTTRTIYPLAGTVMIDVRDPVAPDADTTAEDPTETSPTQTPRAQSNTPAQYPPTGPGGEDDRGSKP